MDRLRLIELIESQTARLSAEGRGLWEELEFLRESIPDPEEPSRMASEYDIMEQIFELPLPEQFLTSRLAALVGALRRAEEAGRREESGDEHRARGVINAAMLKDREEGRSIDAHMTLGRAMVRLEGHEYGLFGRVRGKQGGHRPPRTRQEDEVSSLHRRGMVCTRERMCSKRPERVR